MTARAGGLLAALVAVLVAIGWWNEVHRWRWVVMPDGSSRVIVWPVARANDAVSQAEIGRALARGDLLADDWARDFSAPFDPARPTSPDGRFHHAVRLTNDPTWDDFPTIAAHPDHGAWAAWISFNGQLDELRVARWYPEPGAFGAWNHVPTARGELWRPTAVVDAEGGLWLFWSQREDADYDLFGRRFDGQAWGPRVHLGDAPGGDLDPRAALGPDGAIHLVWQAFDGDSDVRYRALRGGVWSEPVVISDADANDWEPVIAVGADGTAHVVWDTYARDDYDVRARSVGADGALGPVVEVAATAAYEARGTVAVDAQGRVWYAWERGPAAWSKDQGAELPRPGQPRGARIYDERSVEVRVWDGAGWLAPRVPLLDRVHRQFASNDQPSGAPIAHEPELLVDRAGRVHLLYRQFRTQGFFSQYWTEYLTTMTADGWADPVELPWSEGRLSMTASMADGAEGLWLAWPRDNYPTVSTWMDLPDETLVENVYAAVFRTGTPPGDDLAPHVPAAVPDPWDHAAELAVAARQREARLVAGDRTWRLARGDAHRHTDLSSDIRGIPDGSALDLYRYFLDAAHLDWGVQTDHQGGGDRVYWWWLTTKLADLYAVPDRFVPMYGYERSIEWPHGHRNVVFARRGHSPVPIHAAAYGLEEPNFKSRHTWLRPHVFAERALEHDTEYLYEELHRADAVAIPHTTGSWMGTDWRFNDPAIDVVVEIFQGKRNSYEHVGAPLTDDAPKFAGGMLHEGWKKGYHLGVIASSDHSSTHISYAMAWVERLDRDGVMEALRARRTYGATADILLDFRVGGLVMGERGSVEGAPELTVKVVGTAPIARVVWFRDEVVVREDAPAAVEAEIAWSDAGVPAGEHRYYVRIEQADGNVAWSSPVWVTTAPLP